MCNKEVSTPSFPVQLVGFTLTAFSCFIIGQIRSVCITAALVLSAVKLKTSYHQSFLDDIVYSTAFGAFIGSTLGQVYKEQTLSWIMLAIFFILLWWTKESKYDEEKKEYLKWFTVCWASLEIACSIIRVESYLLKVLLTSATSACVTYCVMKYMKKSYEEVLIFTTHVTGGTAAVCLFLWWFINLCSGYGILPKEDVNSYAFVIVVIMLVFSMQTFGLRDEFLDELFQMCLIAIMIIFPILIALLIHPIVLVLMLAMASSVAGYQYYQYQNERAVKKEKELKNTLNNYVLGPVYLSIALGLMVWIFKNYMEMGDSNLIEAGNSDIMEPGVLNSTEAEELNLMKLGDSNSSDDENSILTDAEEAFVKTSAASRTYINYVMILAITYLRRFL